MGLHLLRRARRRGNQSRLNPIIGSIAARNRIGANQHPYAHCGLGIALERSGAISQAFDAFAKNFGTTTGYPSPCINIAALYTSRNQPDEALEWLQKDLGHGYANKGNLEENEAFDRLHELPRFRELMNTHFQE